MNDPDQTILTSQGTGDVPGAPQQPQGPKRDPRIIIAGIGCVLLLCAGVLIAAGYFVGRDQFDNILARISGEAEVTATSTPTVPPTATPIPTSTPEPTEETSAASEDDSGDTDAGDATATAVTAEPDIGAITFALDSSEDYEPIDPGTLFEGDVTEIHAIFEYSGLSPDYTWERVWYLDGDEMLRSAEPWSGADTGVFDYFINAGGAPLAIGEWVLDLFVEGELLATGSFVIVGEEVAEVPTLVLATDDASEHAADLSPTPVPIPTPTSTPVAETFKLAFTKWDGGKHDLFVGDTDGSSEQFILTRAAGPSWSPGGEYIFFYGEEAIDRQVIGGVEYIFDGVSNGIVRINMSPIPGSIGDVRLYQGRGWNEGSARWASVSPNGQMVAYDARPGGNYRIYFLGTDENQQYRFEIDGEQGDWSPDSEKFVYRSGRDGRTGLWISNRDDSGHTFITDANDSFPAWSPDGNTIAFARDVDGNVDIHTVNVDGSNLKRLTDTPGPDTLPIYAPSGEIIFRSVRTGSWSIWKMSGDGANQIELYSSADVGPDWAFSKMSVLR
jgi:TolB protein